MTVLTAHGRNIETVFELFGESENAMTQSLGWALAKCPTFSTGFARMIGVENGFSDAMHIRLQEYQALKGFTDIEVVDPGRHHIVVEAKRGFTVPGMPQLEKYVDRLHQNHDRKAKKLLAVLAESDRDERWLSLNVPSKVKGVPVLPISWRRFKHMARQAITPARHEEKRLLTQLITYLDKATSMQNQTSNEVYVVSLGAQKFANSTITFIDVVEKFGKYFHPVGGGKGGWPVEPPNYVAFRYKGALQSIHHVDSYTVIERYDPHFPVPKNSKADRPHYLYTLGPPVKPQGPTPTNDPGGKYAAITMSSRRWCDLDLLLTSNSIAEAAKKTRDRKATKGGTSIHEL